MSNPSLLAVDADSMLTFVSDTDGSAPTSRQPVRVLSPPSALPLQARPQESENTSPRVPQLQPLRELVLNARTHLRRASWSSGWEIPMGEAEEGPCRRRRRSGRRRPPEVVDSVIFRLGRWWGGAIMDVRKSARGARLFQLPGSALPTYRHSGAFKHILERQRGLSIPPDWLRFSAPRHVRAALPHRRTRTALLQAGRLGSRLSG